MGEKVNIIPAQSYRSRLQAMYIVACEVQVTTALEACSYCKYAACTRITSPAEILTILHNAWSNMDQGSSTTLHRSVSLTPTSTSQSSFRRPADPLKVAFVDVPDKVSPRYRSSRLHKAKPARLTLDTLDCGIALLPPIAPTFPLQEVGLI